MPLDRESSLYGLTDSNCSRSGDDLWGKNQFNSTFPLALCLLMRDEEVVPVSVTLGNDGSVLADDKKWSMEDVIGRREDSIRYEFEKIFTPYKERSRKKAEKIDLVVARDGMDWRALEIKLTVVPDSTTVKKDERLWGPEMVLRPVSSAYAMMGVASGLLQAENLDSKKQVISALKPVYNRISNWSNSTEIEKHGPALREALLSALTIAAKIQQPFLVQPIWKTIGQSFILSERCFDVFVWSDVAITSLPILRWNVKTNRGVTRALREIARHVRAMYDLLQNGDFDYSGIYGGMELGNQTDKAFSLSGTITRKYLAHPRLMEPHYSTEVIRRIILRGAEKNLKPERRFDAAVVAHFSRGP